MINLKHSTFDDFVDYTNHDGGYWPFLQAVHDTVKLGNEIGKETGWSSKTATHLESNLGTAISVFPVLRIPSTTVAISQSIAELNHADGVDPSRKAMDVVKKASDCFSMYSWFATLFTANPAVKMAAQVMDVTHNVADLQMTATDYSKVSVLEDGATGGAKASFQHTKTCTLWGIAKNISSIVGGILGLTILVTGGPILIALTIISLSAAIFEMARDVKIAEGKRIFPIPSQM